MLSGAFKAAGGGGGIEFTREHVARVFGAVGGKQGRQTTRRTDVCLLWYCSI